MRPKALDLFCGGGGATRGLQLAGFHVTGVDLKHSPRYCGDAFIQADALNIDLGGYDLIWASPPCQGYSEATPIAVRVRRPRLIPATRERLIASGRPFIIENVEGARRHLITPIMLCGSMFGLRVWRHRYFEAHGFWALSPATCRHSERPVTVHSGSNTRRTKGDTPTALIAEAMGIDWMTRGELFEAIPPAYSRWLGEQVMRVLTLGTEAVD